jgi:hypothetical protein
MPLITVEAYRYNDKTGTNDPPEMLVDVLFFYDVNDLFNRNMDKAMKVVPKVKIPAAGGKIKVPMPPKGRSFVFRGIIKGETGEIEALADPMIYGNDGQKVTLYFDPIEEVKVEQVPEEFRQYLPKST